MPGTDIFKCIYLACQKTFSDNKEGEYFQDILPIAGKSLKVKKVFRSNISGNNVWQKVNKV